MTLADLKTIIREGMGGYTTLTVEWPEGRNVRREQNHFFVPEERPRVDAIAAALGIEVIPFKEWKKGKKGHED